MLWIYAVYVIKTSTLGNYRIEARDYVIVDKEGLLLSFIKRSWKDLRSRTFRTVVLHQLQVHTRLTCMTILCMHTFQESFCTMIVDDEIINTKAAAWDGN